MSEKDNNSILRWAVFWITAIILVLSPFHAFLVTWLRYLGINGTLDKIISSWREILLIVLFFLVKPKIRISFIKDNFSALLFFFTAFVFLIFQNNLGQWVWGARYDLLPFFVLFVFQFLNLPGNSLSKILKMILGAGFLITIFGLVHALILPQDFMTIFGYSTNRDIWDVSASISSCQFLEHTQNFCRAISVFGGPTRYGTYLLLLLPLSVWAFLKTEKRNEKIFLSVLVFLTFANIFLTYSRSIWVGLLAMIIAGLLILPRIKAKSIPWLKIITPIAILFLAFAFLSHDSIKTIFIRASSTNEHWQLIKHGFEVLIKNPFGLGLGSVGPASLHFTKFITENLYLQIALETGFIGLLFFLGALGQIFISLHKKINTVAIIPFLALIGICVAGLFTHSFEETATMILLFGFCSLFSRYSLSKT